MNRLYRLIFNKVLGVWVVASEYAKSNGKGGRSDVASVSSVKPHGHAADGHGLAYVYSNHQKFRLPAVSLLAVCLSAGISHAAAEGYDADAELLITDAALMQSMNTPLMVTPFAVGLGFNSIQEGEGAEALMENGIAFGTAAESSGFGAIAIGANSEALNDLAVAIGDNASALKTNDLALGTNAAASGGSSVAVGDGSAASGDHAIAFGPSASSSGDYSAALGQSSQAAGKNAMALGYRAQATEINALAFGASAGARGEDSTAIGFSSSASTANAVAIGARSRADAAYATAIGRGAVASNENAVALGAGSTTAEAVSTPSMVMNSNADSDGVRTFAGGTATSTVSIGSAGNERTLTNLAAGRISATSTDGVNGSQIFHLGSSVSEMLGGGADFESGTGPTYTVNGQDVNNVGDAFTELDNNLTRIDGDMTTLGDNFTTLNTQVSEGTIGPVQRVPDETDVLTLVAPGQDGADAGASQVLRNLSDGLVSADSTEAINGSQLYGYGTKINDVIGSGDINTGEAPVFTVGGDEYNDVTSALGAVDGNMTDLGDSFTTLNTQVSEGTIGPVQRVPGETDILTLVAPGQDGADAGAAQVLRNLSDGLVSADSTEAINGSQLYSLGTSIDSALGSGNINEGEAPSFTVGGTTHNNVNSALTAIDTSITDIDGDVSNLTTQVSEGTIGPVQRVPGETDILTLVAPGQDGADAGASQVLRNLSDGLVSATSTEAINGSQLYGLGTNIDSALGSGNINEGEAPAFNVAGDSYNNVNSALSALDENITNLNNGELGPVRRVTGQENVLTLVDPDGDGTNPGASQLLTNLQKGTISADSLDAVNGSQLFGLGTTINNALGGEADVINGKAPTYTINNQSYNNVEDALGGVYDNLFQQINQGGDYTGPVHRGSNGLMLVEEGRTANDPGSAMTLGNLADGELSADSLEAVNGSQLYAVQNQVTNIDNRVTTLEDGLEDMSIGGTKYFKANSDKAAASASGQDSTASGPASVASGDRSVAMGNETTASADGATAVGSNSTASAESATALGDGATAEHANSIALGANSATDRDNAVSVGSAGNERQITNVAAGTSDTDAVNVAQLRDATGNVEGVREGTDGMFQVNNTSKYSKPSATGADSVAGGPGAIASGDRSTATGSNASATGENAVALGNSASASANNSMALGGNAQASASNSVALGSNSVADRSNTISVGSAGAERQITNVAAGTQATDAVNLGQLNNAMGQANAYTNSMYNSLRKDIKALDDDLSAGIAGAMAMASLPQPTRPGASMASGGVANFRGQSAMSIGVSKMSDSGRWISKFQGSATTQGDVGVSLGVGYQW